MAYRDKREYTPFSCSGKECQLGRQTTGKGDRNEKGDGGKNVHPGRLN